jgi:hypothetical protein
MEEIFKERASTILIVVNGYVDVGEPGSASESN